MNSETQSKQPIIQLTRVTRKFGAHRALDEVSLSIPRGSMVGVIGRNGAGKTTLLRHIHGAMLPTQGTVMTLGRSAAELGESELNRIGAVDQEGDLLDWMFVGQHLRYIRGFYES